jgi:hypothetical protein
MLSINAKNAGVAAWYCSYGAVPLPDATVALVMPLNTIAAALSR